METQKIDHRRNYIVMLDTETANDLECPLTYDIGWAIIDKWGTVYRKRSFVNPFPIIFFSFFYVVCNSMQEFLSQLEHRQVPYVLRQNLLDHL